jgi:hypothetical protein
MHDHAVKATSARATGLSSFLPVNETGIRSCSDDEWDTLRMRHADPIVGMDFMDAMRLMGAL